MRICLSLLAFVVWIGSVGAAMQGCRDCAPPPPPRPHPPGPLPPPVVTLQVIAPCRALPPDGEIPYEIVVTNRSPVPAHFVTVKDSLPGNAKVVRTEPQANQVGAELQWSLGTLDAGECKRLLLVLKSTGGDIENCIRVAYEHGVCVKTKADGSGGAPGGGPGTGPGAGPGSQGEVMPPPTLLKAPKLDLAGDVPARQPSATPFAVKFSVSNPGEGTAKNVMLAVKLPPGLTYESSTPPGDLFEAGKEVRWRLNDLEAKKNASVELKLKGVGLGRQQLTAIAQADGNLKAERDYVVELFGGVGMHMEIRDTVDPLMVGEETEYAILVRNTGSIPATRIQLTAAAPVELRMNRPRGPADDVNFREGDPTLTLNPFNLQAGQEVVFRVSAKGLKAGLAKFRVQMTADQLPSGPVLREEVTNVLAEPQPGDFVTAAKPPRRAADWGAWLATLLRGPPRK